MLVACGEKDLYDFMREEEQKELDRRQSLTQEQRDAEDLAKKKEEEKAEQELKEKWERIEKQKEWELENTDKIHYRISRYSKDGKFVEQDKYVLTPLKSIHIKTYNLENRNFNEDLDNQSLIVDGSFFKNGSPSSKFDIYYILWKTGSRDEVVDIGIGHRSLSRGW